MTPREWLLYIVLVGGVAFPVPMLLLSICNFTPLVRRPEITYGVATGLAMVAPVLTMVALDGDLRDRDLAAAVVAALVFTLAFAWRRRRLATDPDSPRRRTARLQLAAALCAVSLWPVLWFWLASGS
jgi:hypothetical protein